MLSGLLTIMANRSGVGWSWDSSDYVAVGKNFANGLGLLDATGIPMTVRPPGLSMVVAIGDWLGLSVFFTIQVLNVISAMTIVIATHYLLGVSQVKKSIQNFATAFIAVSTSLLWQYSMIWSEPVFIAILAIAMIVSLRCPSWQKVVKLAVLFATLFFVRYVGPVFAVAITVAATLIDRQKIGMLKATLMNFVSLALSMIPVWLWLQRNKNLDGTLTGARAPGGGTLLNPLKTFTGTLGSWLIARPVEGSIYLSWDAYPQITKVLGVIFVLTFVVLLTFYLTKINQQAFSSSSFNVFALSAIVLFMYVGFSAYRFVHWELGPLDNRMMVPIYLPLVLIIAISVNKFEFSSKPLRMVFTVCFAGLVLTQAVSSLNDSLKFGRDGRYWAAQGFKNMPIHRFVNTLESNSSLMSNQPQQLFAIWQKSSVFNQNQLESAQRASCNHRYFVWYNSTYDDGTPNFEGQPEGSPTIFTDESGLIYDLGDCATDVTTFWP